MYRMREPSQLCVAAKKQNGVTVGFVIGFVKGQRFVQSLRANMIFKTNHEALAVLETMERNTRKYDFDFEIIERGESRYA